MAVAVVAGAIEEVAATHLASPPQRSEEPPGRTSLVTHPLTQWQHWFYVSPPGTGTPHRPLPWTRATV